jgi:phage gp29-like protein
MPRQDVLRTITPWSPGIKPTWRVSEVRLALRLHAQGDFSLSAQLVDTMGEDDEIPGALERRADAVLQSEFKLDPVEAPNRQLSKRIAELFGPLFWDLFPEGDLAEFLQWYYALGVTVAVLVWERGATQWKARLKVLHPQYLRWDQERGKFIYYAQEGEQVVEPGDGKWFLFSDGQRGWMRGIVRKLAILWIAKQLTLRDWNRYNERHGLPIIKAFAPAIADDEDQDQFWEDVKAIEGEAVAQLPSHLDEDGAKFDLELLEAKDASWPSFEKQLQRTDRKIQITIVGGNLGSEVVDQGARSAADTHRGVERTKATSDAKKLATELRRQGLFPIVAYNIASVTIEVVPWPCWDTSPPADDKAEAESKEAFGKALTAVKAAGYKVKNVTELAERYDLDLEEIEPPPPPTPPQLNPGVPPALPPKIGTALAKLATFAKAAGTSGQESGQQYADELAEQGIAAVQAPLAAVMVAIEQELDAATGYDDLLDRLRKRYETLDPHEIVDVVESVMVLGEIAGRVAVTQDS